MCQYFAGNSWGRAGLAMFSLVLLLTASPLDAQLTYEGRLGFYDPEHTRENGLQFSQMTGAAGGYFRGTSTRYDGTTTTRGATAWIASAGGVTTRVGLYDGIYGSTYQESVVLRVTASGISAGTSGYFNGFTSQGTATWIASSDGATTVVGLTSAVYTRNDGYRNSTLQGLTSTGYAYGSSDIYNGGSPILGQGAWVASLMANNRVGLTGALFTGSGGLQNSTIAAINSAGSTVGSSTRYNGGSITIGQSAFRSLADGGGTQIGLYDATHTRSNGYAFSEGQFISENGYTAGFSNRYAGSSQTGQSAWRADASGVTSRIGFYTPEFADGNVYSSEVTGLLSNGSAIGSSVRGPSGAYAYAGWIVDTGGSYRIVGLSGTGYTNPLGYSSNRPEFATNSGFVAGRTSRFNPTTFIFQGYAAFVENLNPGETAVTVGLYDAAHVSSFDGSAYNYVSRLTGDGRSSGTAARIDGGTSIWAAQANGTTYQVGNYGAGFALIDGFGTHYESQLGGLSENGYVWGTSTRSASGNPAGYAGWLFSLDSATQINLADYDILSPAGYGTSAFLGVNEDGVAFGYYADNLSTVGFIWSEELGLVSVGEAVDGGIAQYDWTAFQTAFASADGMIAGTGRTQDGSTAAYMVVPEPSTYALLGLACAALVARGFQKDRKRR